MDLSTKKAHVRVPGNTFLQDDLQYFNCISFKQLLNQDVVVYNSNENEEHLESLTIDELKNKIKMYNKLFVANKINMLNAFDIELISCVQKIIKTLKNTDFLEITMTFDTMSKVYSCRVDNFLTSGYKLIKEVQNITKNTQNDESTIKTTAKLKPTKKRLMLTSAEKLCHKENHSFFKLKCLNNFLNKDMMFGERAFKQINNMFYDLPYWPEHKNEKTKHSIYSIEDISHIFKEGTLCPQFHQFSAEFDNNIEHDDLNNLENIDITFDQDTFRLKQISIHDLDDNQTLEFMDVDNISCDGVMIEDFSLPQNQNSYNENQQKQMENLNNIKCSKEKNTMSELLSMVNTTDISEYTFFDPGRIKYLKCEEHWKEKFNLLNMTSKQKRDYISLLDDIESNVRMNTKQSKKDFVVQYNIIFKSNMLKSMNDIATGINQSCISSWNCNKNLSSSIKLTTCPVRRLNFCEFINMKPKWLESTDFKIDEEKDSIYLYPNQDAKEALDTIVLNRGKEYYDANNVHDNVQECDSYVMNWDDIQSLKNNKLENNFLSKIIDYTPRYIDMHTLKECLLGTIKPDGNMVSKITLNDIFQQLLTKLPENISTGLSVALVFVALLHLANEHMLNLENSGDDIIISQGF